MAKNNDNVYYNKTFNAYRAHIMLDEFVRLVLAYESGDSTVSFDDLIRAKQQAD